VRQVGNLFVSASTAAAAAIKLTITVEMVAEHFGVRPEPDGLKKWSRLQNDHPELHRKAQVAALVIAENRRRQIEQRSKLARFSQTQVSQNSEGEEKNDQ